MQDTSPTVRRRAWLAVVAIAIAVLVASVLPLPENGSPVAGPLGAVGADAWLHAVGYAAVAGSLAVALATGGRSSAAVLAYAAVVAMVYGLVIEFLQAPVPTRAFEPADLVANAVGVLASLLALYVAARLGRGPLSPWPSGPGGSPP